MTFLKTVGGALKIAGKAVWNFVKTPVGIATTVLIALTLTSGILLSSQLVEYVKVDEREVMLTTNMDQSLDIFSAEYLSSTGEVIISGAYGDKVIAPGANVDYTIRIRNSDKTAIDYEIIPKASYTSDYKIPILIRMIDGDGNYVIGDAKTWVAVEDIKDISDNKTLVKGETEEYVFQWKWDFESGNDSLDTELGNAAATDTIGVKIDAAIHAVANTEIGTNGGVIKSGLGNLIYVAVVFVIVGAASALNIVLYVKRKK